MTEPGRSSVAKECHHKYSESFSSLQLFSAFKWKWFRTLAICFLLNTTQAPFRQHVKDGNPGDYPPHPHSLRLSMANIGLGAGPRRMLNCCSGYSTVVVEACSCVVCITSNQPVSLCSRRPDTKGIALDLSFAGWLNSKNEVRVPSSLHWAPYPLLVLYGEYGTKIAKEGNCPTYEKRSPQPSSGLGFSIISGITNANPCQRSSSFFGNR